MIERHFQATTESMSENGSRAIHPQRPRFVEFSKHSRLVSRQRAVPSPDLIVLGSGVTSRCRRITSRDGIMQHEIDVIKRNNRRKPIGQIVKQLVQVAMRRNGFGHLQAAGPAGRIQSGTDRRRKPLVRWAALQALRMLRGRCRIARRSIIICATPSGRRDGNSAVSGARRGKTRHPHLSTRINS